MPEYPLTHVHLVAENPGVEVGGELVVAAQWKGQSPEVSMYGRTFRAGFGSFGMSIGWNRDVLGFPEILRTDVAPHMMQFLPRVSAVYRANERDPGGKMLNDGDLQLICFGNFGSRGEPGTWPTPEGITLVRLRFPVLAAGDARVHFDDQPDEVKSLADNCVIFANTGLGFTFRAEWHDLELEVAAPDEPSPEPVHPIIAEARGIIEELMAWAMTAELEPHELEMIMRLRNRAENIENLVTG